MCFAIPKKIVKIKKDLLVTEDGLEVKTDSPKNFTKGDYAMIYGDVAVSKVIKTEALKIRSLLKELQ